METKKMKLALIELILKEDDEIVLNTIKTILEKNMQIKKSSLSILEEPSDRLIVENSNKIIGYDAHGKALSLSEYHKEIEKGIDDIKNHRYISQQDLEKEIEYQYD